MVKLLLKFRKRNNSAIQVNKAALNGDTPLIIAEFKGHAAVVDELLGREVIELDQALFTAAMNGRDESVALLLSNESIDVNKATHDGTTPLLIAAENGHNKVVQMILAQTGIEINKARFDGATPPCLAAKFGHKKVVNHLLKQNGIQINKATKDGSTPLHIAATKGHNDLVELLKKNIIMVPNDNHTCIVCMDSKPEVALVPCGHKNLCGFCANRCKERQHKCPTDRTRIVEITPLGKQEVEG